MLYPEISSRELIEKLDSDDFYKVYGNPVKCKIFDTDRILMSSDLYERLFGKVDLDKENTIEMDEFKAWVEESMMDKGAENDN